MSMLSRRQFLWTSGTVVGATMVPAMALSRRAGAAEAELIPKKLPFPPNDEFGSYEPAFGEPRGRGHLGHPQAARWPVGPGAEPRTERQLRVHRPLLHAAWPPGPGRHLGVPLDQAPRGRWTSLGGPLHQQDGERRLAAVQEVREQVARLDRSQVPPQRRRQGRTGPRR